MILDSNSVLAGGVMPIYSSVDAVTMHSNLDAALATYFDEMRRDGVRPHGQ